MAIYKSGEDYLETILILSKNGNFVRSIDVATEMGFSKASVSRAVNILKNEGLITIEPDGQLKLTEKGEIKANSVYSRHNLLKKFFIEFLGVDEDTATNDACKIEHVISEQTYLKLKEYVKNNQ